MSKADELKSYVPEYLLISKVLQQTFNTLGGEFDRFDLNKNDVFAQCFLDTATWGLDLWDQFAGTQTRQLDTEERRNIIKVKLMTRPPCTSSTLLNILKNLADDAEVDEDYANYSFDAVLKTKGTLGNKINYIIDQIELIKPAHLDYRIIIDYLTILAAHINFSRYQSVDLTPCGTADDSGNPIVVTDGRRYSDNFIDTMNRYFSVPFTAASTQIYPNRSLGKRLAELITDTKKAYFSDTLQVASESTYTLYTNGIRKGENVIDKCTKYFSTTLLQCSPNTYCGGGVYA